MANHRAEPEHLTTEMARQIRAWRVDGEYTWRAVAQAATERWGSAYGSNQLYGQDLCEAAARLLGENPAQEPWN
ncbi:hypothetical protein [Streptomyces sp. NPDC050145]|uniref:hypothetical protein n=1 Tax=Streptomyces sp. NPDC050145 TaxID=3365602 RepID=UPI0037983227